MKKLITTAIPYMNGAPHIGHALEIILTDVLARGFRLLGEDVFFLTGSDEHGNKIVQTAEKKGCDVMEMLDENVRLFQAMNTALWVSNDDYLRTTDRVRHWPVVQALWTKMADNLDPATGEFDIYKKTYAGWYCDREERFVTEEELDENKCLKEGGAPTRWTEDENYFFRLSRYSDQIREAIMSNRVRIVPEFRKNEMIAMIGDGLEDVSFSRTKKQLTWGIPVPGDPDHVMYVWCDALANYLPGSPVFAEQMAHAKNQDEAIENLFQNWNCDLHVIGKDIARFHCLTWIGMLLSAGIDVPKSILVHGFVNDKDGAKMSKSVGNVVDPHVMIDEYGSDTVRLYMTSEVGVGQDLNFSDDRIQAIHNDILANNYGNLVNRVLSLWIAYRDTQEKKAEIKEQRVGFLSVEKYQESLRKYDTQGMFNAIRDLLNEANNFLNTTEPWKKSGEEKGALLLQGIIFVYYATLLLSPFIPEATNKVMRALGIGENVDLESPISIDLNTITKPEILFVKK